MATESSLEGGCLCGNIRYRLTDPRTRTGHCHCSMCRRAGGAPVVTWITAEEKHFTLTKGEPAWYRSSDHARRAFCPTCGTPLLFVSTRYAGTVDVTAGSLDHPERLVPVNHVYEPDRIPWVIMTDGLPRHVEDSRSPLFQPGR